ncbi:hypothetical protein ACIBSV_50000 [Embleya sp. NPDC050154]
MVAPRDPVVEVGEPDAFRRVRAAALPYVEDDPRGPGDCQEWWPMV